MRLVMGGKQGSGKGTQGQRIAAHFGLSHQSTGDILRQANDDGDRTALAYALTMAAGQLAPDGMIGGILARYLPLDDWVLDGSPRTVAQARWLVEYAQSRPIRKLIILHLEDDTAYERLVNRRICEDCGEIYNMGADMSFARPREAGFCDVPDCEGMLYQRDDDEPDAIRQRLALFAQETEPAYRFLIDNGIRALRIRADDHPDEITRVLIERLT